jgi:phage replication O-like protein O
MPALFLLSMDELRASPQLENGYARIANELMEEMGRYRFSGAEFNVLWIVLRLTYGWKRKEEEISFSKLVYFTELDLRHVKRIVKRLVQDKVLIKYKVQQKNVLGLNKNYFAWRLWKTRNHGGKIVTTQSGSSATGKVAE